MLAARVLFYALIISLLIAMITASLVGLTYFFQTQLEENLLEENELRNLQSGLALLLEEENQAIPEQERSLFETGTDKVRLSKYSWGLFTVAWVETLARNGGIPMLRQIALIGEAPNVSLNRALYLADHRSPLALSGNTTIRGDVLLPKAGVKRGYVDGQNYLGNQLIYGTIGSSQSAIPDPPKGQIRRWLQEVQSSLGSNRIASPLRQSFRDSTVFLRGESMYLSGLDLAGRIVIQATDSLVVAASTRLEDVILVAPTIVFEAGFRGSVQAIATKRMTVGPGVQLQYPSVLGLVRQQAALPNGQNFMVLEAQSEVQGLVFVYSEAYSRVPERLLIEETAVVKGQVVIDGNLELKGSVWGNVTCGQFVLRTPSSVYSNHLHNATIDRNALEPYYCSPFFYNVGAAPQKIAKWLH